MTAAPSSYRADIDGLRAVAVSTVLLESSEPTSELSVAPAFTPTTVPVSVPPEARVSVPAFTVVAPV